MNATTQSRFPRPLTSKIAPAVVDLIKFYSPASAADHLVLAWDAISAALRGEKEADNIAFARNRLECAMSASVAMSVKPGKVKAYEAECKSLAAALADYVL